MNNKVTFWSILTALNLLFAVTPPYGYSTAIGFCGFICGIVCVHKAWRNK